MESGNWQGDSLGRQEESLFLSHYLRSKYQQDVDAAAFILNVSAERGLGKSYFLRNWAADLIAQGHPVVQFNAWQTDFSGEPLLALLAELHLQLAGLLRGAPKALRLLHDTVDKGKNLIKPATPVVTSMLNSTLTGFTRKQFNDMLAQDASKAEPAANADYHDLLSSVMPAAADQTLKNHKAVQENIAAFKDLLAKLLQHLDKEMQSLQLPLFVFVDELDHCRPEYAIQLLEKIRQLFVLRGIVFVVAADAMQLAHAIKSVYGRNADASRYLQQFFDQQYNLIQPRKYQYAEYLFHKYRLADEHRFFTPLSIKFSVTRNVHMDLFAIMSKYFRLGSADQDQVCSMLHTVCLTWNLDKKIHLTYLLFLLMLQQRNPELLNQYLKGTKLSERISVFKTDAFRELVDDSVIIRTNIATTDRIHTPEKKEPLGQMLHKYVEYANQTMPEITDSAASQLEVYLVVREQLTAGMPQQYNPETPPRHELWRYHDIVKKVSHLIRR